MVVRGVALISLALFVGIAALVIHLVAIYCPEWKKTKRDAEPAMAPVSYGVWDRCERINQTALKQGVALGVEQNIKICRPNLYMRYSPDDYSTCYNIRRNCPVIEKSQLPKGCSCRYLPSTKGLQWLTCLAALCLIFGLLIIYLKVITTPQNDAAVFVLSYGPFICFFLALLLMVTGLILVGAYFRQDIYEDYSFPLDATSDGTYPLKSFDLHSLRNYAKHYESTFNHERYLTAEHELMTKVNTHYHTKIGSGMWYEIIATILVFLATALTFWIGIKSRSDDI